jgi:hypothetical protein
VGAYTLLHSLHGFINLCFYFYKIKFRVLLQRRTQEVGRIILMSYFSVGSSPVILMAEKPKPKPVRIEHGIPLYHPDSSVRKVKVPTPNAGPLQRAQDLINPTEVREIRRGDTGELMRTLDSQGRPFNRPINGLGLGGGNR